PARTGVGAALLLWWSLLWGWCGPAVLRRYGRPSTGVRLSVRGLSVRGWPVLGWLSVPVGNLIRPPGRRAGSSPHYGRFLRPSATRR
ncbi:MAG: hypothetical protein WA931_07005, partial [Rhodococcus sp. (in: high G+C Gram-positive bacteria)]